MWKALPITAVLFIYTSHFRSCMIKFENLYILIAEDDIDDGEIVRDSFLTHPSFSKAHWVKNGKELLDFLHAPDVAKPDVILTDINMPILNGIEALQQIHTDAQLRKIPLFVYSSTINPIYETKCKELGTRAFLTKPFNLGDFNQIPVQIISTLMADDSAGDN